MQTVGRRVRPQHWYYKAAENMVRKDDEDDGWSWEI